MTALTYGVARVAEAGAAPQAVPGKSWFARLLNAVIEARMAQARREIRMHLYTLPYTLDERGNSQVK